ncbi:MAG: hypothetical protein KatS3mg076_1703 [Candidatus Binatia bacterium]|nr:MAG: hypothetical protein KatS3mg076_1703 [Candidatus Binatia bacterium]
MLAPKLLCALAVTDRSLVSYSRELDDLTCRQAPLVAELFALLMGLGGAVHGYYHPETLRTFAGCYAVELTLCALWLASRHWLHRRGWIRGATIALGCLLALCVNGFSFLTGTDPLVAALASVYLAFGLGLLLPWGPAGQSALAATLVATYVPVLRAAPAPVPPPFYSAALLLLGLLLSIAGAHNLYRSRLALYRQARKAEDEASLNAALLALAEAALQDDCEVRRLAERCRSVLRARSCAVYLRTREGWKLGGQSGDARWPEKPEGAFSELFERLVRSREPLWGELAGSGGDPSPTFGASLRYARECLGILVAEAPTPGAESGKKLGRALVHHAAAALHTVLLVRDLREANRVKTDFLASVSHELRTPLNVVLGYAALLREGAFGEIPPESRRVLERIHLSAARLLELIECTLEVQRLETGRTKPQRVPVPLVAWVEQLRSDFEDLPRDDAVSLVWRSDLPEVVVELDVSKTRMIVRNLVSNALKYSERGTVEVSFSYHRENGVLEFSVEDTGLGIDPEELPRVFEMFERGARAVAGSTSGLGLGLYLVRRFVEQLGGTLEVDSRPGEGSLFRVFLPAPELPMWDRALARRRSATRARS